MIDLSKFDSEEFLSDWYNLELRNFYLYTILQIKARILGYENTGNLFKKQAEEELEHAQDVKDFIISNNMTPSFFAIDSPRVNFASLSYQELFTTAYNQEKELLDYLSEVLTIIKSLNLHALENLVSKYVDEQVEEVERFRPMVQQLQGLDKSGLLVFDSEILEDKIEEKNMILQKPVFIENQLFKAGTKIEIIKEGLDSVIRNSSPFFDLFLIAINDKNIQWLYNDNLVCLDKYMNEIYIKDCNSDTIHFSTFMDNIIRIKITMDYSVELVLAEPINDNYKITLYAENSEAEDKVEEYLGLELREARGRRDYKKNPYTTPHNSLAKNRDMNDDTYKLRRMVMDYIYEARDLVGKSNWERVDVRIVDLSPEKVLQRTLAFAVTGKKVIFVPASSLEDDNIKPYLKFIVFHELCHALFGTPHIKGDLLMDEYLRRDVSDKQINLAFIKHYNDYKNNY